jgi:homocitrate synthase NifV
LGVGVVIRITDITLCTIDCEAAPREKLLELYLLLLQAGISFIEINEAALAVLAQNIDKSRTVLRIQNPKEVKYFPGFIRYICRYSGYDTPPEIISEIQINDIKEIKLMNRFSDYRYIRVIGLDDLMQYDYLAGFNTLRKINRNRIEFCPQNSYNCAGALATEWIINEGENIAVSFSGSGGFAPLEEVVMALCIAQRYKPNLNLSVLQEIKKIYEDITGEKIFNKKPVIGSSIFDVESGIHVDGIFKNGSNYEPFKPSVVGMERKIIIGKHSGRTSLEIKLKEFGIILNDEKISELLNIVQSQSIDVGRSISDEEFIYIAKELMKTS